MPTNEYVEVHNGGYYVAGTRIGLDVITNDFRRGRSAETIFDAYPSIGSLAKVYGAITFILERRAEVDEYLADQERIFERFEKLGKDIPNVRFGLGLWISREVVNAMRGTIAVSSRLGNGSTVTVKLPKRAPSS